MRETSELWVQAYLRRCRSQGADAVLARRGQRDAGAIWLRIAGDGDDVLYAPALPNLDAVDDRRRWEPVLTGPASEIDARLRQETSFDDDLWVVDVWGSRGDALLENDERAVPDV